jgi:hypothetical protein
MLRFQDEEVKVVEKEDEEVQEKHLELSDEEDDNQETERKQEVDTTPVIQVEDEAKFLSVRPKATAVCIAHMVHILCLIVLLEIQIPRTFNVESEQFEEGHPTNHRARRKR